MDWAGLRWMELAVAALGASALAGLWYEQCLSRIRAARCRLPVKQVGYGVCCVNCGTALSFFQKLVATAIPKRHGRCRQCGDPVEQGEDYWRVAGLSGLIAVLAAAVALWGHSLWGMAAVLALLPAPFLWARRLAKRRAEALWECVARWRVSWPEPGGDEYKSRQAEVCVWRIGEPYLLEIQYAGGQCKRYGPYPDLDLLKQDLAQRLARPMRCHYRFLTHRGLLNHVARSRMRQAFVSPLPLTFGNVFLAWIRVIDRRGLDATYLQGLEALCNAMRWVS